MEKDELRLKGIKKKDGMDKDGLHLEQIDRDFKDLDTIKAINKEAFPPNERFSLEKFFEIQDAGFGYVLAILDGDLIVGFAIICFSEKLHLILYFAIDKKYRGKGYGTRIVKAIKEYAMDESKKRVYILDVETPDPESSNYQQRKDRIRFYKNLGYRMTNLRFTERGGEFAVMADSDTMGEDEIDKEYDLLDVRLQKILTGSKK